MTPDQFAALEARIEALAALPAGTAAPDDVPTLVDDLLRALETGALRAARRDSDGTWHAVPWVKRGILVAFRFGALADLSPAGGVFSFVDKATMPTQRFGLERGVRIVPGGSSVRRGAFLGQGVVCMPPMFVNVGAHVGAGTMIDSHALIGSCAQIGERCHISAASQIGRNTDHLLRVKHGGIGRREIVRDQNMPLARDRKRMRRLSLQIAHHATHYIIDIDRALAQVRIVDLAEGVRVALGYVDCDAGVQAAVLALDQVEVPGSCHG